MIVQSAILQDGVIYIGKRHADIIHDMVVIHNLPPPIKGVQGFVDDKGNFLDRYAALVHFVNHGQQPFHGKFTNGCMLFSEDLY